MLNRFRKYLAQLNMIFGLANRIRSKDNSIHAPSVLIRYATPGRHTPLPALSDIPTSRSPPPRLPPLSASPRSLPLPIRGHLGASKQRRQCAPTLHHQLVCLQSSSLFPFRSYPSATTLLSTRRSKTGCANVVGVSECEQIGINRAHIHFL